MGNRFSKKNAFSSQTQLLAHRAHQKKHQILPVHPVDRLLSVIFHPHELVVRHETLLEQLARYPVIREQADQPAVPRHHYEHVSRLGLAAKLVADHRQHALVLAAHVSEVPDVVELVQARHAQHGTSSFSISTFSPT